MFMALPRFFYTIYIRVMSWQVVAGVAKPGQRREIRRLRLARCSDVFEDIDWVTSSLRGSWVQIPPPASQIYCCWRETYQLLMHCDSFYKSLIESFGQWLTAE